MTRLNPYTFFRPHSPRVAAGAAGRFLVVWADHDDRIVGHEVVAQRFAPDCGDGVLNPGEACDDGGIVDGDGCRSTCEAEPCFACAGAPSACSPITVCASGDGCCLPGCSGTNDAECPTQISGAVLVLRDFDADTQSKDDQLVFKSTDAAIDTTLGAGIDPVADGAVFHVYSATGGDYDACYQLRTEGAWTIKRTTARGPVFAYEDHPFSACHFVRLRDGLLRVRCIRDIGEPYALGSPLGAVAVHFASGATEYCAVFGGRVGRDGPQQFSAVRADAPTSCPAPVRPCPLVIPLGP